MPIKAAIFAWTVVAAGVTLLSRAILFGQFTHRGSFTTCLALACIAATFKLKLPKLTGTISPAFVFVLMAIATQSWAETIAIAALSGLVQCLWKPHATPSFLQAAFNTSAMAIAGGVAYGAARILLGAGGPDALIVILGAAGVTLLLCNTLLVTAVICLAREAPFVTAWRSIQLWAVPYYLTGGMLADLWTTANLPSHLSFTILALASVYLLSECCVEIGSWFGVHDPVLKVPVQ